MPVFSLKEAKELQVKNVSENTFKYWGESATYGYFGGGQAAPGYRCVITRLDFSNEIVSDPGKNLSINVGLQGGVVSNLYGYFGGGYFPPASAYNTISRLDFSTESVSLPGKNLPNTLWGTGSIPSSSYGYFGGGAVGGFESSVVTRLDFLNETISSPGKNLPTTVYWMGVAYNNSYGYFGGGSSTPGNLNTITKFDLLTENTSNPGKNLPFASYAISAVSSNSYGYYGGGQSGPLPVTYYLNIRRLDFSTETVSLPGKDLSIARHSSSATSSSLYGYFGGGSVPANFVSTIDRLDFSSETTSLPGKNLPTILTNQTSVSGGQSIFRPQGGGTKTYGYIAGGLSSPPFIFYSDIYRIDFSSDVSAVLPGVGLPPVGIANGRRVMASVASNYYGYFGGGYFPPGFSPSYYNRIDRIDFSNSTNSVPGKNLSTEGRFSGTSGSSYGFFTGYNGAGSVTNTQLLDFSTENTLSTPQPNGGGGGHQASVSNTVGNYGYTMDSAVTRRIDFSTSNISLPGQNAPLASRNNIAGFENREYGYFGGGYRPAPAFYFCVLDRLDFSNETYTASTNLPLSRSWHSGASSNTHGYFFAGTVFPGATVSNAIIKFDFASAAWNTSITSFIPSRYQTSALSN